MQSLHDVFHAKVPFRRVVGQHLKIHSLFRTPPSMDLWEALETCNWTTFSGLSSLEIELSLDLLNSPRETLKRKNTHPPIDLQKLIILIYPTTDPRTSRHLEQHLPCPSDLACALVDIGGGECEYTISCMKTSWQGRNVDWHGERASALDTVGVGALISYSYMVKMEIKKLLKDGVEEPKQGWRKLDKASEP
jgi:hypothetical protein